MRELIARGVLVLTFAMVLGLALVFATLHNPDTSGPRAVQSTPAKPAGTPSVPVVPTLEKREAVPPAAPEQSRVLPLGVEWGRRVFFEQNCGVCHAVGGEGNPRLPLDDVGGRETLEGLRIWITGTGEAATQLSSGVRRKKLAYQSLPDEEMNALLAFLSSLKGPSP